MSPIRPADPDDRPVVEHTAGPTAFTGWRRAAEISYVVVAVLYVLSVFVQFFLAGLGSVRRGELRGPQGLRRRVPPVRTAAVDPGVLVRRNRIDLTLVIVLFVLTTAQFSLPEANDGYVQALHVLNALIIYTAAYHVLQRGMKSVRRTALLKR